MYPKDVPRVVVSLDRTHHYFRSVSELKECKHGGYIEGYVQLLGVKNAKIKNLELKLIPSSDIFATRKIRSSFANNFSLHNQEKIEKIITTTHCNLMYVSSTSLIQNPNLDSSGWRINLERTGNKLGLSRQNHPYIERDLPSDSFWIDQENKLKLGKRGLQITIVKPLSKENKISRPGIHVSDVIKKRFEESLSEECGLNSSELKDAMSAFEQTELLRSSKSEILGLEELLTKHRGMHKANLHVTCTLEDNTKISGSSDLIIASNKYVIEIETTSTNQILMNGVCQCMVICFKKCEPTIKMGIKAGFEWRNSDGVVRVPIARVIDEKRTCKGNGLIVVFQTFDTSNYDHSSFPDSTSDKLFLILKVFEDASSNFYDENFLFLEEREMSQCLLHPTACKLHPGLTNTRDENHRNIYENILKGFWEELPYTCELCKFITLPAFKRLKEEFYEKSEDVSNVIYSKIFHQSLMCTKRARFDHRLGR